MVDMQNLAWFRARRPPPNDAVASIRQSLASASVWRLRNHGVSPAAVENLKAAGRAFFDQPASRKMAYTVGENMDRSRGWELYPQHWRYHRATLSSIEQRSAIAADCHQEPSAREGILCERFVCGPPSICSDAAARPSHPFYDSPFARVFYERNTWPEDDHPALRPSMEHVYSLLEPVAAASLQCLAAACDLPFNSFDHLVTSESHDHPDAPLRHHSRLQLNNYPSQLRRNSRKQIPPIRASRHLDTALLSVLCREPSMDGRLCSGGASMAGASGLDPGRSGALEVQLHSCADHEDDGSWEVVPTAEGELTAFVGSLASVLTGFAVRPTTHRVSNPAPSFAAASRRMSIGYVLKPDYTAPAVAMATAESMGPTELERNAVPCVGQVGRIGWQYHAMQSTGISRAEAVAAFKPWKNATLLRLRTLQQPTTIAMARRHAHAGRVTRDIETI